MHDEHNVDVTSICVIFCKLWQQNPYSWHDNSTSNLR